MNIVFIPARIGSKSIPKKNIKIFNGKPLIQWAIEAAIQCECIDRVVVSTESQEIIDVVPHNIEIHARSKESTHDTVPTKKCMFEFLENNKCKNIVLVHATNPFVTSYDIESCVSKMDLYDTVLSVIKTKQMMWKAGSVNQPVNYSIDTQMTRQFLNSYYLQNNSVYCVDTEKFKLYNRVRAGKVGFHVMPGYTFVDINTESDWRIAEVLHKHFFKPK